jgi:hypothetical protein
LRVNRSEQTIFRRTQRHFNKGDIVIAVKAQHFGKRAYQSAFLATAMAKEESTADSRINRVVDQ